MSVRHELLQCHSAANFKSVKTNGDKSRETAGNMNLMPVLLCVVWLLNTRVVMSQEPVVMLRQGTVRGVSTAQVW
jgi:hypothetical protein